MYRIRIICKSIPFGLDNFDCAKKKIIDSIFGKDSKRVSWRGYSFDYKVGILLNILRIFKLYLLRFAFKSVALHLNYIDNFDLWKSYGVSKDKIIKTGNASDSDLLLAIANSIKSYERPKDFKILHVGRLVQSKRVDLLINAVFEISKLGKNINLDIIGDGPELDRLKEIVEKYDLTHKVSFKGAIYEARVLGEFHRSASVCVLAGMGGLTIYEAMCFGLPVICSVCDGTERDLVTNGFNGFIFEQDSIVDLIRCIKLMMDSNEMLQSMSINSMNRIKNEYNINYVTNKYHDAILISFNSRF